ncbi:hypothetical protein A9Q99_20180 [Gammaproteobacteria bacterium 45_16_T64]|nr:hypothetical protein A9Q99_20180 [Gammaproteobacteria bacterium 45_16_T64]
MIVLPMPLVVMRPYLTVVMVFVCWLQGAGVVSAAGDLGVSWSGMSKSGKYLAVLHSDSNPVAIGSFLRWKVSIEDTQGNKVNGLSIRVVGGMPGHRHGMPSSPKVTPGEGTGEYLIKGLKFSMAGEWVVVVHFESTEIKDQVTLPIILEY